MMKLSYWAGGDARGEWVVVMELGGRAEPSGLCVLGLAPVFKGVICLSKRVIAVLGIISGSLGEIDTLRGVLSAGALCPTHFSV